MIRGFLSWCRRRAAPWLLALCFSAPRLALAQEAGVPDEIRNDSDPTKPILFSLREEYYNLLGDAWRNAIILRADRVIFRNLDFPGRGKGLILRGDLPVAAAGLGGTERWGLGDLYAQAIVVPRLGKQFTIAYGTGFVLPTATDQTLGQGKWQLAPVAAPVWFFEKRKGLAFVKFQDYFSFAGDGKRPDVNYLLITPTALYRVTKTWFLLADSESKTDWKNGGQTSFKSGLEIGKMLSPRFGLWIKSEVPWGPHRQGDFTIKLTAFWTRF